MSYEDVAREKLIFLKASINLLESHLHGTAVQMKNARLNSVWQHLKDAQTDLREYLIETE